MQNKSQKCGTWKTNVVEAGMPMKVVKSINVKLLSHKLKPFFLTIVH